MEGNVSKYLTHVTVNAVPRTAKKVADFQGPMIGEKSPLVASLFYIIHINLFMVFETFLELLVHKTVPNHS